MKVLIYSQNNLIIDDLMEKTGFVKGCEVVVSSYLQAINALKKFYFTDVILNINSIADLKLMKFINENNPNIKISLFGDDLLNEIIPIIKQSNCKVY